MYISKCEACMEECPQAQGRHEAAVGRMYAMRELAKCAPYWDSLFDENEEPKITPARLRELVEADRDGRCSISPKLICIDEVTTPTPEQYRWMMGRFLKGEQDG